MAVLTSESARTILLDIELSMRTQTTLRPSSFSSAFRRVVVFVSLAFYFSLTAAVTVPSLHNHSTSLFGQTAKPCQDCPGAADDHAGKSSSDECLLCQWQTMGQAEPIVDAVPVALCLPVELSSIPYISISSFPVPLDGASPRGPPALFPA